MAAAETRSEVRSAGHKAARAALLLSIKDLHLEFHAKGHKSSEGDGRTAADIRAALRKDQ